MTLLDRSAAFAPALLAGDRRAQAPAAPLLRCRLSTLCFTRTAVVWRCPGQSLYCRLAIRPPHALPSRGALRQGVRLPAWTASVAVFPHLSSTYSSHLLLFFTSLWPAAFRGSLALTPAGRYPLRPILFGLARRLPKIQGKASSPRSLTSTAYLSTRFSGSTKAVYSAGLIARRGATGLSIQAYRVSSAI